MTDVLTAGPSSDGQSMDKLRCLANGARRHINREDARAICDLVDGLSFRLRAMVQFYDEHVSTPCAQIRWQQEREEYHTALTSIRDDAANAVAYIEQTDIEARLGTIIYYADKALGHVGPVL